MVLDVCEMLICNWVVSGGMRENADRIQILVSKEIRDTLREMGKKGETYSAVIARLIEVSKNAKN